MIRITSTYVEKTNFVDVPNFTTKDHLHIRGENVIPTGIFKVSTGSPPHTWRKLYWKRWDNPNFRITSTYVEKTLRWPHIVCDDWDHLHIRGENLLAVFILSPKTGSPPHTWRKRQPSVAKWLCIRITSTYVEKTPNIQWRKILHRDHLHIRGENKHIHKITISAAGSPPHTWRKLAWQDLAAASNRITSTYVEKTQVKVFLVLNFQDHLHIRGENLQVFNFCRIAVGSPPHTWRKRDNKENMKL